MMNRRLGYAAVFALSLAPLLIVSPASAQRKAMSPRDMQNQPAQAPAAPQQEKTFPLGASWTAVSMNGKSIAERKATLQIDSNLRGTGYSGCNTFSAAAYPLRQQGIAVGPMAITKRSCDKGAAEFERAYLVALRGARNWDLVEGRLVIKSASGELRFDRGI